MGIVQGQMQGDHAAHAETEDVGRLHPQRGQHGGGVAGHVAHGIARRRRGGAPRAAIVEGDHVEIGGQIHRLPFTFGDGVGDTGDDEQRRACCVAGCLVINTVLIAIQKWHSWWSLYNVTLTSVLRNSKETDV